MRKCRVDRNQREIVECLRQAGRSVQPIHTVGSGCPDILVGYRGNNYLFEIKDGNRFESEKKLTPQEKVFHELWRGKVHIVESFEEALKITEGN